MFPATEDFINWNISFELLQTHPLQNQAGERDRKIKQTKKALNGPLTGVIESQDVYQQKQIIPT